MLIHEGVADSTMWDDHVERARPLPPRDPLRPARATAARRSRPAPGRTSRDLAALLDGLGVERASVVGVSVGGRIALEFALEHPDRVDALVLVAPGLPDWDWSPEMEAADEQEDALCDAGDVEGAAELAVRIWFDGPHRSPDEVDAALRERAKEMNRRAYAVQIPAYAADDEPGPIERLDPPASKRLGEVRVPTLVVAPELDLPDILGICDLLAAGIPGARKVVMDGVAHFAPMESPDEFTRLVLDFLAEPR